MARRRARGGDRVFRRNRQPAQHGRGPPRGTGGGCRLRSGDRQPHRLLGDAEEARGVLAARRVDGVFLDVVFDRTPEEKLCGDPSRARPADQWARQQGFYIAAELADVFPDDCRVVIAYDFAAEPGRLAALRATLPSLEGVEEGAPLSRVLERLVSD